MNVLTFAPMYDSPGKHDATGAFQPERDGFCSSIGEPLAVHNYVDNHATKAKMRAAVLYQIDQVRPDLVAFFCHGWKTGIQFGFDNTNVLELAKALALYPSVTVALYACNTADGTGPGGDNGFADRLRDALCTCGAIYCRVDAHDRPGHTTRNPYVRRFEGRGSSYGGTGGAWIVAPKSALWSRWVKALKETDLRYRFPTMTMAEIHTELANK